MIGIIDYGLGNLFSLQSSIKEIGEEAVVTRDPEEIRRADRLILPGVGAFRDAAALLAKDGLGDLVKQEAAGGKPLLGICLGMQLLFDKGFEYGEYDGLGLIPGEIRDIRERIPEGLKVPHIGWNRLQIRDRKNPLFDGVNDGDCVYFVHSYSAVTPEENVLATTEYGGGSQGERHGLSVPPGKKRYRGSEDPAELRRDGALEWHEAYLRRATAT